ncbi:MAG TPA: CpsB/CapC family capsule biosynthesis tyrosine phosphatase, partial [Solirubrobacter sp.]|nr:CpsB/CapC family capsule biosynthesis tyrosine phosphatase [Solirubrobacter sp.]
VHDVACTSHIKRAHFPDISVDGLNRLRADTQRVIDAEGLKVRLHPGGELAHDDALELEDRDLEAIAQGPRHARWLLLETPFEGLDDAFDAAVERLTGLGYGLLVAHPERALGPIDRLRPHVEAGALLQVNVSSLLGDHGPRARQVAERLVTAGLAYCLASDAHPGTREQILPYADDALQKLGLSHIQVFQLTRSNPRFLLHEGNPRMALPSTEVRVNTLC